MKTEARQKPNLGDVRFAVEWTDAATWEKLARAEGWTPEENGSLYDYVEAFCAEKAKLFSSIEAAKEWAEKNADLDEWKSPFVEKQVYADDGYGPPYSWTTETREIWDDGEWSEPC